MTDRLIAQCLTCARWRSPLDESTPPAPDATPACDAYPDAIPDAIWWNRVDHRQAQPDDQGLQWASRAGVTFPVYVLDLTPAPAALLDLAAGRARLDILDRTPHDGKTTDLAIWQADRSAAADQQDELNAKITQLLADMEREPTDSNVA